MMVFSLYSATIICLLLRGINGSFLKITTLDGDPYTNLSLYNVSGHDRQWLSFDVTGADKNIIGLFGELKDIKYEIIIGDGAIQIRSEDEQDLTASIDPDMEETFWIGWRDSILNVGYGFHFPVDEQLNITDPTLEIIHSIGVKSLGNNTEWKIRGEYIGCLEDISTGLLETLYKSERPMTSELCRRFCRNLKTKYAGTTNGTQCYCGNSFDVATPVLDDMMCNVTCDGDATKNCGGENATTLFLTEAFCSPGNYLTSYQRCLPCPLGFYQNERDKYSCDKCPPQMTTVQTRSIHAANCSFVYLGCYTLDSHESLEQMKATEYTSNDTGHCLDFCSTFQMQYTFTNDSACICNNSLDDWTRTSDWICEECLYNLLLDICKEHEYFSVYKTQSQFIHKETKNFIPWRFHVDYRKQHIFKEAGCGKGYVVLMADGKYGYMIVVHREKGQDKFLIVKDRRKLIYGVSLLAETNCNNVQTYWLEFDDLYFSFGKGRQLGKNTIGTINNTEMYKPDSIYHYSRLEVCWGYESDIHVPKQSACDTPENQMTTAITSTCMCNCSKVPLKLVYTDNDLKQKIDAIKKLLKVDTKTTKAYQRRKISARDMRTSAIGVGSVCAMTILLIFLITVLMMDATYFIYLYLLLKKHLANKQKQ